MTAHKITDDVLFLTCGAKFGESCDGKAATYSTYFSSTYRREADDWYNIVYAETAVAEKAKLRWRVASNSGSRRLAIRLVQMHCINSASNVCDFWSDSWTTVRQEMHCGQLPGVIEFSI